MEFEIILFYVFSTILIFSALGVVLTHNFVYAALFLVLAFFSAASIWILLEAEFLAILLVLVYVGAVMVLFLFIVMMLDINTNNVREKFFGYFPLAIIIGTIMIFEMIAVLSHNFLIVKENVQIPVQITHMFSNIKSLGILIYTNYIFAFEIASVILLLAVIAVISITIPHHKNIKLLFDTTRRVNTNIKRADRIRVIKDSKKIQKSTT